MGIRREETQSGLPVRGDADARVCPLWDDVQWAVDCGSNACSLGNMCGKRRAGMHNIICLLSCAWQLVAEKQSDRLDHPYGWTVVDTTSMYSNKTTLNFKRVWNGITSKAYGHYTLKSVWTLERGKRIFTTILFTTILFINHRSNFLIYKTHLDWIQFLKE